MLYLAYRGLPWYGTTKNEAGKLVENLRDNTVFKNSEHRDNFNVEKVGSKNSVNWNHTKSILNRNKTESDLIHVDKNHTNSNKPITSD